MKERENEVSEVPTKVSCSPREKIRLYFFYCVWKGSNEVIFFCHFAAERIQLNRFLV